MNFKPFYIHHNLQGIKGHNSIEKNKPIGFTVKVEPVEDNPREVKVAVAFCSQKDQFCKAIGRAEVEQHSFNRINIRKLPQYLAEQESHLLYSHRASPYTWNHVLKYVV